MSFFETTATGRALRDGTRAVVRIALPAFGVVFLATAVLHVLGGPCLLPGSVACSFKSER